MRGFLFLLLIGLLSLATPLFGEDAWVCPMHCEGTKSYSHPGKCPVCGMSLEKAGQAAQSPLNSHDYRVEVVLNPKPPIAGQKTEVTLIPRLTHDGSELKAFSGAFAGALFTDDRILVQRLAPQGTQDGHYHTMITFPGAGNYLLYFEFTPAKGKPQIFPLAVRAEGTAAKSAQSIKKINSGHKISVSFSGIGGDCLLLSEDTTFYARLPVKHKSSCSAEVARDGNYRLWYRTKHGEEALDIVVR